MRKIIKDCEDEEQSDQKIMQKKFEVFHLDIFESANRKILIWSGCMEHDAASELITANLLSKPSLETGLCGEFTYNTGTELC